MALRLRRGSLDATNHEDHKDNDIGIKQKNTRTDRLMLKI